MWLNVKKLSAEEKSICTRTLSPNAAFALVADALARQESLSVIRMGDGEHRILQSDPDQPFSFFEKEHPGWNRRLGIEGMPTDLMQKNIIEAGNRCTYFAPSVSGISLPHYDLYSYFEPRPFYLDNFFVENWLANMIKQLLLASGGLFILHREPEKIVANFRAHYDLSEKELPVDYFQKDSWQDNEAAIAAVLASPARLVLFSAGPGGKIIGPEIAECSGNKVVIDVGNSLIHWSQAFIQWCAKVY
jgi:hypothetical protein